MSYAQMAIFLHNILGMHWEEIDMVMEKARKEGHAHSGIDTDLGTRGVKVEMTGVRYRVTVT